MPRITITPVAYVDMILAIDLCPVEVSGLGDVSHEGNIWQITSCIVIPQRCRQDFTHLDPVSLNRYLENLVAQHGIEAADRKKLWWHSHGNSIAYFSGVDLEYIEINFGRNVPRSARNPWLISIVGNKSHEMEVRLDIFRPRRLRYRALPLFLSPQISRDAARELYRERRPQMVEIIQRCVTIVGWERSRENREGEKR